MGGPLGLETSVLVANTSAFAAQVQVTVVFFPSTTDKRFGLVVESLPTGNGMAQIVVERASYNDAVVAGQTIEWAAGSNAFGTKLW